MANNEKLHLDYQETRQQVRTLADIRFKLLAFVPTISGLAVLLLTDEVPAVQSLAIGGLGLLVTLGILFYEVRNTKLYNAAMHRARGLEAILDLPLCTEGKRVGGLTNERPGRKLKLFGLISIWHDRGLALIYGAALGGWIYIIALNITRIGGYPGNLVPFLIAAALAASFIWEIQRLDRQPGPQPSPEMHQALARRNQTESFDD